ncbi:DUF3467 domain-containing protein [Sphingobacterium bovistauri]|uniref:DUF3467 domain-containing protein n=1 Tax=Sphingobacterium bovistauri TaxID=2781959 RepID=A0ABS7ZCP1_9SPHI|nr:DUF3467 domain-containing protein [Sphingobacterium bovistauri]MCA5006494.1 DUF3467 domain-containing protein [Sphingobacterium bovistauri]
MSDNNQNAVENTELSIELTEEVAEGIYSNLAIITHSTSEFVLDFVRVLPGVNKAKVKSRIILTPEHAFRLYGALQDNLKQFEAQQQKAFEVAKANAEASNTGNTPKDFPYPLDLHPKGEA